MNANSEGPVQRDLCMAEPTYEPASVWKKGRTVALGLASALFAAALAIEYLANNQLLGHSLFLAVILLSGYPIIMEAGRSLLERRLGISFLMTTAAFGAFIIGQADEGAAVMYLFSIAESLEGLASDRARTSITSLLKLSPNTALVKVEGKEVEKHVHEIVIGDIAVVKPGERIPVDGTVLSGHSAVNQSAITGESTPVDKNEGSEVFAGSINGEGFIEIRTTKLPSETVLAKVVRLLEQARSERSPTESFVERFSKYYTPLVVTGAVLLALIPPLTLGGSYTTWFYRALILLVVSCPCALTISTPVSMVSSITGAARNGVLIKGGKHVESLARVRMFLFDKTGTLTSGTLGVSDIVSFGPPPREVLRLAASVEAMSEHPIAKAITNRAREEKLSLATVSGFESLRGVGLKGLVEDREILVGKKDILPTISEEAIEKLGQLQSQGKTSVLVINGKNSIGIIALRDSTRHNAKRTVSDLKRRGIDIAIISGDNQATTAALATELGVSHYHAELLPQDKVGEVAQLRNEYGTVAMVGDGVNDAPALAKANVGIAMGVLGSDVAIETADVALMQDDLSKIPYAVDLSRKTLRVVKENITASILVKGTFALLALPGLVTLALAVGVGDMGLSLGVILNAIRLNLVRAST